MKSKLDAIKNKFERLCSQLYDPAVAADPSKTASVTKEMKALEPVALKYGEFLARESDARDALAFSKEPGLSKEESQDFCEEYNHAKYDCDRLWEELKILLLPKDENDDRNVIMEIRSSAGGEESALFASDLYRMYTMYANAKGFTTETLSLSGTELGGIKEIVFMISGSGVYRRFKFESGVHRVQRIPVTESNGKIQTSTATVAVLPEAQEVDFELNPNDLKIDTFRSSGAGGQHINKTSSAIRVTHIPTGMVVECQDERSQYKNKDRALKILRSRLLKIKQEEAADERAGARKAQVGTGDRSERIRTYNFPQGRVTDHRIGLTLYKIDSIINGSLDELTDALNANETAEKLKAQTGDSGGI